MRGVKKAHPMCQRRQSVRKPFVCTSLHIIHVLTEGKYITSYTVLVVYIISVEAPVLTAGTTTATTITISWSSAGSEDVSYEVMWETDDVGGCSGGSDMNSTSITDDSTSYAITELEEDSTYSITVTAFNSAGSSPVSNTVTAMTMEAGERQSLLVVMFY